MEFASPILPESKDQKKTEGGEASSTLPEVKVDKVELPQCVKNSFEKMLADRLESEKHDKKVDTMRHEEAHRKVVLCEAVVHCFKEAFAHLKEGDHVLIRTEVETLETTLGKRKRPAGNKDDGDEAGPNASALGLIEKVVTEIQLGTMEEEDDDGEAIRIVGIFTDTPKLYVYHSQIPFQNLGWFPILGSVEETQHLLRKFLAQDLVLVKRLKSFL